MCGGLVFLWDQTLGELGDVGIPPRTSWRGQLVLWCLVVAMCLRGCSAWVKLMGVGQVCERRAVSPPCSCSRENGLLPRQEAESLTGHSPSWSSRHLAGFCKPWLKAAFLL